MKRQQKNFILIGLGLFFNSCIYSQNKNNDYLVLFADTINEERGYRNFKGDTIIPLGKYPICYTDTLKFYAIVLKPQFGFVAIDRNEKILYEVFPFDNGPDPSSDGVFRIKKENKIGYADSLTGQILIQPQFDCAFPFIKGIAKVSNDCKEEKSGEEHKVWVSYNWFYIDKNGSLLIRPRMETDK